MGNTYSSGSDPVLPQPNVTFTRGTANDDEFAKLSEHVNKTLSTLASCASKIPVVGEAATTYLEVIIWLNKLPSDEREITYKLIDERILTFAISHLNAEMEPTKNRINRMADKTIKKKERKLEVTPALQSCEKILTLFKDEDYCLWKEVIKSSLLLFAFVTIYADVIIFTLELVPSYKEKLKVQLNKTVETLEKYKEAVIKERIKSVQMRVHTPFSYYDLCGDGRWKWSGSTTGPEKDLWTDRTDSEPLPWGELSVNSEITDRWVPWYVYFKRDAFNDYRSHINELRKVYEGEFNKVIIELNNLIPPEA